ncbi:MAG TPA: amidohydrolase family protein [Anaerolineaceae bacterium]
MQPADLILRNALVITMDKDYCLFDPGAVAVNDGKISAVGKENTILEQFNAGQVMDCKGKVLMPGLINAHTHVPMTLLRGLADDLRLDVWLMGYVMPVEREFVDPEFVYLGTLLACAEMIQSGVTCFLDMYYFEEEIAQAVEKAGMRAVLSQTVLKFPTPDANSYEESIAYAEGFIQRWKGHPLVIPSVAPHAPYTCTPQILRECAALAVKYDVPLQIHIAETAGEVERMRADEGMPVVPYVKKQNLLEAKVVAAHCVHIDDGEIRTLSRSGAGAAHNPSSNLKLASGFAPVKRMLEQGLNVGIGTDGPASNNDLDMFEEIRLAALIAKGVSGDPTTLPARTALSMATRIGAQALHISHLTGSIEPGKCADLILVDLSALHNSPRFKRDLQSVYAQLVYSAKSTDVSDVMVNGKWLMKDHSLLTIDLPPLLKQQERYAHQIDAFLIQREKSILSKLIAIGGASEEESFEVQIKVRIPELSPVLEALNQPEIEILRQRHYREYDTYFLFDDPNQGRLRIREDHFIGENGEVYNVRSRLTLIGQAREGKFPQGVVLSRSRYLAPATQGLRFYREYFKPSRELEIEKDRLRYLVRYKDTEFYINIDQVHKPELGSFLEIKSRTWSRQDAENKSILSAELIEKLHASVDHSVFHDYFEMIEH